MEKYLTISEAADKLGVSKETLRRWDNSGKFKSSRHPMNNYRVYPEEKVNNLISEMKTDYSTYELFEEKAVKPYYSTDLGELYSIDAIKFLRSLTDESVDLIISDPPYNIKKAEWDSFQSQKEYVEWSLEWIREAQRVLKKEGTMYVYGFSEILADIKWSASHLFKGCKWLVWFYRNKANLGNDWGRSHESLLHFRKSKKFIFNIDEVRIPYNEHTLKYPARSQAKTSQYNRNGKEYNWTPNPLGAKPKDVFEIPTISNHAWEKTEHPTQKPIELIKKCVLASSNEGSLVVDPFGGSGTTYAVCEAFDRKWKGAELSKDYCKIIKNRLEDRETIERIKKGDDEVKAQVRRKMIRNSSN
jgi:site-specific DNA-methyltransferase (adenine-specific)